MMTTSFDFIIVGAGTAGIALATRFAEKGDQSVLVLEAGEDHTDDPRVKMPAFYTAQFGTEMDWGSRRLRICVSLNQDKNLGGSSRMNAHVYAPLTQAMLDGWVELGNPGWEWDTMGPYYTKAFTSLQLSERFKSSLAIDHWGPDDVVSSGPVRLSYPGNPPYPIRKLWAELFKQRGYVASTDPWLQNPIGAFSSLASIDPDTKERNHAAKAYLAAAHHRQNLGAVLGACVEKIVLSMGQKQPGATGVQYYYEGSLNRVDADKEVIIAAGALHSPKLLELSGIGNPDILNKHASIQKTRAFEEAMLRYSQHREGLLTSTGIKTFAYLPTMEFLSADTRDEMIQLISKNLPTHGFTQEETRAGMYNGIARKMLLNPKQAFGMVHYSRHACSTPFSRGTVHIISNKSIDAPDIDPKYLSNPLDAEIFVQIVSYIKSIASSTPLSSVLKQPLQTSVPSIPIVNLVSARRYIESRTISMWHPAGTCAMLPEQVGGVVDTCLKVHGVGRLRVVDSSVVPLLPSGNLQSTIYAIAERAADLIKSAHRLQ
ncbi:oxidoreductase [Xylariaceae sp. FL0255]|nr:oxidoreductase [Xylariaceae sp. FL0255]